MVNAMRAASITVGGLELRTPSSRKPGGAISTSEFFHQLVEIDKCYEMKSETPWIIHAWLYVFFFKTLADACSGSRLFVGGFFGAR